MNPLLQNLAQTVLSQVLGNNNNPAAGAQNNQLLQGVLSMLAPAAGADAAQSAGQNAAGGLNNLIAKFQQSGLDDVVASWVGTGANKAVSAEQVQQALGAEQVQQLAAQAGVPAEQASNQLAQMLPELINQLTPNGAVDNGALGQILAAFTANQNKAA